MIEITWNGNAMDYAMAHVAAGVLRIDDEGRIWRTWCKRRTGWFQIDERRAENIGGKGYLRVSLQSPVGLVMVMAHRLVYECTKGAIPEGKQINHKDLRKQHNAPSNLEVVSAEENIQHSYRHGRTMPWSRATEWRGKPRTTVETIEAIRARRRSGALLREIAAEFGLSTTHVHRLCEVAL